MQTSYFLAKLIGPFCLILGIGVLVSSAHYRRMMDDIINSRALVFFSGLIILPAGLAIVLAHNVWVAHWPVIITVLGWLCVIGGTARIVVPQYAMAKGRAMAARTNMIAVSAAIWLAVGAILSFFGYIRTT